jgi:uncharacterized protein (TIGR02265 family)
VPGLADVGTGSVADHLTGAYQPPTIKGIFVNSHIQMVRKAMGENGLRDLEDRMGGPLRFRATDDVPIRDEVRLIEHALDLTSGNAFTGKARAFEAGRLHFRNFSTTPWAKVLFTLFPRNFRFMTLHAKTVAERVFSGVRFESEDLGPSMVRVTMHNADYPIEHFRGFFQEWMGFFGYDGIVEAHKLGNRHFQYTMNWT